MADPELTEIRPVEKAVVRDTTLVGLLASPRPEGERTGKRPCKAGLDAFVLDSVCSAAECAALCAHSEELRYSFWNVGAPEKKDFRNADTVEVHDPALAERIWERVRDHVVPSVDLVADEPRCECGLEGHWEAYGINPHLLFARYGAGGHFSPHTDGYTIVDFNTRSLYSLLLYLNDCGEGGATRLLSKRTEAEADAFVVDSGGRFRWPEARVVDTAACEAGTALAFFQDLPHEGEPVGAGCAKYIIRTDVMYRRAPSLLCEPHDQEAFRVYRQAELLEADGDVAQAARMFRRCMKLSPGLAEVYGL